MFDLFLEEYKDNSSTLLSKEEVREVIFSTVVELMKDAGRDVVVDFGNGNGNSTSDAAHMEIIDVSGSTAVPIPPAKLFQFVSPKIFRDRFNAMLDRAERERIYSIYRPMLGEVSSFQVLGTTFQLGRYSGKKLVFKGDFEGTIADLKLFIPNIYIESGKEKIEIPEGKHMYWDLAEMIYDQSQYVMSINPHRKILRLRKQHKAIILDIGGVQGIMPPDETIPSETYSPGDKVEAIIYNVSQKRLEGYQIYVSRRQLAFISKLLDTYTSIKSHHIYRMSRIPGIITAILVHAEFYSDRYADREMLKKVSETINGEKIMIIPYFQTDIRLTLGYLFPKHTTNTDIIVNDMTKHVILVTHNKGAVIGKGGMKVKIAGMLTGYKYSVYTPAEYTDYLDRLQKLRTQYTQRNVPKNDSGVGLEVNQNNNNIIW